MNFSMTSIPKITKDGGKRTATGGSFMTCARIEADLWKQMKAAGAWFVAKEEEEDGIGSAGWHYPIKSLCVMLRAGQLLSLDGIECKTIKELFDVIENLPRLVAEQEQTKQQKRNEELRELAGLIEHVKSETGLTECVDWSWDDFGFSTRRVLAESDHYTAEEYWTTRSSDLLPGESEKLVGFVIKNKPAHIR